jgi:hypothetical protein
MGGKMKMRCERMIIHRPKFSGTVGPLAGEGTAEAVPWCKTHQQEMLTGLRCAIGWDEEIADLRLEVEEIKPRYLNRVVL